MNYPPETDGERLAHFIGERLIANFPSSISVDALIHTGRAVELAFLFREISITNLTCRIVTAGRSLLDATLLRQARHHSDPTLDHDLRRFLRDALLLSPPGLDELCRHALRAVAATQERITESQMAAYRREAQRSNRRCYMCGVGLVFEQGHGPSAFTMDHIWPRCYGGNSNEGNLLPACNSCNSGKKRDLATWAMTNPHALILGFTPGSGECDSVEGPHRYALHVLAAQRLASKLNINLKAALARLGSWGAVRVADAAQLGDFFNLANHAESVRLD